MAKSEVSATEQKIEDFAEELGRLLGSARAKADSWLGQRQQIAKTLEGIRDTATSLLSRLGHQAQAVVKRRGRPAATAASTADVAPAPLSKKKRRKMSAAARKKISEAQKARWAKQKSEKKK
jgi:hypothetical protein